MLNSVHLIGRLGADPIRREVSAGVVCIMRLGTTRTIKKADGTGYDKAVEWHQLVAFSPIADTMAANLKKGRLISVQGRIQTREYNDREGHKQKSFEVVVENFQFLDKNPEARPEGQPERDPGTGADDDLPF